jgi:hypothetical protein
VIVFTLMARPTGRCFGNRSKRRRPLNGRGEKVLHDFMLAFYNRCVQALQRVQAYLNRYFEEEVAAS